MPKQYPTEYRRRIVELARPGIIVNKKLVYQIMKENRQLADNGAGDQRAGHGDRPPKPRWNRDP